MVIIKKRILLIGSIFAVLLLLLVSFNGVASANVIERYDMIQSIRDRIENNIWQRGEFLLFIVILLSFVLELIPFRGEFVGLISFLLMVIFDFLITGGGGPF